MDELVQIVNEYVMPYGKHKGVQIQDLFVSDKGYLEWLARDGKDPVFKYAINLYLDSKKEEV